MNAVNVKDSDVRLPKKPDVRRTVPLSLQQKARLIKLVAPCVHALNDPTIRWEMLNPTRPLPKRAAALLVEPLVAGGLSEYEAERLARLGLEWVRRVGLNSHHEASSLGRLVRGHLMDDDKMGREDGLRFMEQVVLAEVRIGFEIAPYPTSSDLPADPMLLDAVFAHPACITPSEIRNFYGPELVPDFECGPRPIRSNGLTEREYFEHESSADPRFDPGLWLILGMIVFIIIVVLS